MFSIFSHNPYGGKIAPLDSKKVAHFKENCRLAGIENYYIHAPYYINLASLNNKIFYGSIKSIQVDLERAEQLGAKYVLTHIGSAKDFKTASPLFVDSDTEIPIFPSKYADQLKQMSNQIDFSPQAFWRVIEALEKIANSRKKIPLLLEIAAGAGAILGVKFEELAFYLNQVPALAGICFDTAHAFASGYDLRDSKNQIKIFNSIDKIIGKNSLKLIHLNDSMGDYESHIDRHAHLGEGKLGRETFRGLVDYFSKKNYNVDMILETPTEAGVISDIALLKGFRNKD